MSQSLEQESAEMRPHYTTASDLNIRLEPETATMSQSAFDRLPDVAKAHFPHNDIPYKGEVEQI